MTIEKFIKLVSDMRRAQLDYYRDRTYGKLVAAKDLERQVDNALRKGIDLSAVQRPNEPEQKQLFTEGEQ